MNTYLSHSGDGIVHVVLEERLYFTVCNEMIPHPGDIYYVHVRTVTCLRCLGDKKTWSTSTQTD